MKNIANLIEHLNLTAIDSRPSACGGGIDYFNVELKISFDKDTKLWTGQIRNDSGIAFNSNQKYFDFSDESMKNVIDNLISLAEEDF